MAQEKTIQLTLVYLGQSHAVQTDTKTYYSLMTLISDHLAIPGFGLCCGMGSCGTCVVELASSFAALKRPVLACSVQIDDALSNSYVFVPDKVY